MEQLKSSRYFNSHKRYSLELAVSELQKQAGILRDCLEIVFQITIGGEKAVA